MLRDLIVVMGGGVGGGGGVRVEHGRGVLC